MILKVTRNPDLETLAVVGGWCALILLAVIAYAPGLSGPFVLDDFGVIAGLADNGGVTSWETLKAFVFDGYRSPTGRPLAMLTFVVDADNWPTDSFPLKRTNLIIHVANGALLGVLVKQILSISQYESRRAHLIALVATAFWLLHPFLVSTTLYVVQRMAQLSTLFIFAGLVSHLHFRSLLSSNSTRAYAGMSVSIVLFTTLAMMSKENGILLPLLIGVVEISVIAAEGARIGALNRNWLLVFVVAPTVFVFAYLAQILGRSDALTIIPPRDFSLFERLLTEPRVLLDYLRHWFVPEAYSTGIFQDHFIKSTGILTPATTILSVLVHVALIATAIIKRRKWPLYALAVLFFYAGHVLESSVVNLELYFEHRNYLPASLLFLPVIAGLNRKLSAAGFFLVTMVAVLVLAGFTRYSATVWESFPSMVVESARKAPTSARAQAQYATLLFQAGEHEQSLQVIDKAIENVPGVNPHLLVNRLIILCELNALRPGEYQRTASVLSDEHYDPRLIGIFSDLVALLAEPRCSGVAVSDLQPLFKNMLEVPSNAGPESLGYSHLNYLLGVLHVHTGEPARAVALFEESLRAEPGAGAAMTMANLLAINGYLSEALSLTDLALLQMAADERSGIRGKRYSEDEIRAFQAALKNDMNRRPDADTSGQEP